MFNIKSMALENVPQISAMCKCNYISVITHAGPPKGNKHEIKPKSGYLDLLLKAMGTLSKYN